MCDHCIVELESQSRGPWLRKRFANVAEGEYRDVRNALHYMPEYVKFFSGMCFGPKLGQTKDSTHIGILEEMQETSPDVADAVIQMIRYDPPY